MQEYKSQDLFFPYAIAYTEPKICVRHHHLNFNLLKEVCSKGFYGIFLPNGPSPISPIENFGLISKGIKIYNLVKIKVWEYKDPPPHLYRNNCQKNLLLKWRPFSEFPQKCHSPSLFINENDADKLAGNKAEHTAVSIVTL